MAYSITWQDVLDTAKDEVDVLSAFTASQQQMILDETYCFVPETYGDWTPIMRRYFAAHIAVQSTLESAGEGAYTTESIGGVSASKNQPVNNPAADQPILETIYGRQYWHMLQEYKKRFIIPFGVCGSNNVITGLPKILPSC